MPKQSKCSADTDLCVYRATVTIWWVHPRRALVHYFCFCKSLEEDSGVGALCSIHKKCTAEKMQQEIHGTRVFATYYCEEQLPATERHNHHPEVDLTLPSIGRVVIITILKKVYNLSFVCCFFFIFWEGEPQIMQKNMVWKNCGSIQTNFAKSQKRDFAIDWIAA